MLIVAARDQRPHGAHARAGRGRAPSRAADRGALRHEPRAGRHTRGRQPVAGRGPARHRCLPRSGRRAGARHRRHASPPGAGGQFEVDANELGVARWVYEHRQPAGLGTTTLPGASALHVPLIGSTRPGGRPGPAPDRPPRHGRAGAPAPARDLRLADRAGAGAGQPRHRCAGGRGADRDRAAAELPAQLGVARSPHAAGDDHRRGQHDSRRRHAPRRDDPARAAGVGARGGGAPEPAGAEPARDDAARVGRAAAAPATFTRRRRSSAPRSLGWASGWGTGASRPACRPTCRSSRWTTCSSSRCWSTCSTTRSSTRRPAARWRSSRRRPSRT